MKRIICINIVILFFLVPSSLGQNDSVALNRKGVFDSDEILEISLRFDIRHFKRTKFKSLYQHAAMTYISDGDSVTRKIKLRSRGKFRREYCNFPPIRLNLKKNEFPDDIFEGVDKIKMVTHCESGNRDHILKEYLAYKLYNIISDFSFRVRLVKVTYIDTRKPDKPFEEYAFLIEPTEFLTERTNTLEIETTGLSQKSMKQEILDRMAVFNYMIGNYDWIVPKLQNLVILSQPFSENSHLGIPVPYDFDYSGIVNADYAVPPDNAPVSSVRERLFLGLCRSEEKFEKVTDYFLGKKDAFYKVIEEFPYLGERPKSDMINYLNTFYEDFDQRNTIVRKLLNECLD